MQLITSNLVILVVSIAMICSWVPWVPEPFHVNFQALVPRVAVGLYHNISIQAQSSILVNITNMLHTGVMFHNDDISKIRNNLYVYLTKSLFLF